MDSKKHDNLKDPFESGGWNFGKRDSAGEYVGNVFGWRVSLIGAAVIVLLGGLAVYRHWALEVPFGMEETKGGTSVMVDTMAAPAAEESRSQKPEVVGE